MLSCACTTSLTNLSDPHALRPGHLEVTLAGQGTANSVVLSKSWDGGAALYQQAFGDQKLQLAALTDPAVVDTGVAWALFAPRIDPELQLRCGTPSGPLPGADIGLRISPSVAKLDGKLQLLGSDDGRHALALQAGYAMQHGGPHKQVEWLTLVEFGRQDFDLMASYGWRWPNLFEGYLGPRALFSLVTAKRRLEADLVDELPAEMSQFNPAQLFRDTWLYQAGGTAGIKAGYKYVFIRLELNAFYMWFRPIVLGQQRVFDGVVVAPSVALSGTW